MDAPGMFLAHLSLSRCHLRHDSRRPPRDLLRHFDAPSRGGGGGGRLLESIARRHAAKLIRIKGPRLVLGRFPKICELEMIGDQFRIVSLRKESILSRDFMAKMAKKNQFSIPRSQNRPSPGPVPLSLFLSLSLSLSPSLTLSARFCRQDEKGVRVSECGKKKK